MIMTNWDIDHTKPTFEDAKEAATIVRNYMDAGETCRGPYWYEKLFMVGYTLQEWCNDNDTFVDEYNFIHAAQSHNYHRYEDPEY